MKILKNRLISGMLSVFGIIIFAGLLVAINLFLSKFDIKYDMTKEKIYTLSEQTKKIIKGLDQKINIYVLSAPSMKSLDKESSIMSNIISQYKSQNINISYKDPEKNPDFINKYEQDRKIFNNSIIVEGEKKFKLIDPDKLFSYSYSFNYETYRQEKKLESINVEPEISSAIYFVTSEYTPKIYKLIGHGESDLNEIYRAQIKSSNYEIEDLNLITKQKIPDDCKILFMTTLKRDLTSQELDLISDYLASGSAIMFMDISNKDFPNLKNLTKKYGFEFSNLYLIESNANNYIANNRLNLVPNYTQNEICEMLESRNYRLLMPLCQNILINSVKKDNIQTLLETSSNSYAKSDLNNPQKQKDDPSGPFGIAVFYTDNETKIIAVGTESILDDKVNKYIGGSNLDFVVSSINNLNGDFEHANISAKTYNTTKLNFSQMQSTTILISSVFVLPAVIVASGIIMMVIRRYLKD